MRSTTGLGWLEATRLDDAVRATELELAAVRPADIDVLVGDVQVIVPE